MERVYLAWTLRKKCLQLLLLDFQLSITKQKNHPILSKNTYFISRINEKIFTAKTPPSFSTRNSKPRAMQPSKTTRHFTKMWEHRSVSFKPKQPFTKSSRTTTAVELRPTDRVLRHDKTYFNRNLFINKNKFMICTYLRAAPKIPEIKRPGTPGKFFAISIT